jgi:hypothetical protein
MATGPDRPPIRPDFGLLSGAVRETDRQGEQDGLTVPQIVAQFADVETAVYVALQRALRVRKAMGGLALTEKVTDSMLASMWLDGFVAGCRVERGRHAG